MAKSVCLALLAVALFVSTACAQQELTDIGTDGNLDQCQVILGSMAAGDGTFDKDSDFSASLNDGVWSVPLSSIVNNTGDVLYVVPAARSANYAPLTLADRQSAGYCYDTTTLLPQYNPMAVQVPDSQTTNATVTNVAVSPITTLHCFGYAYGLREDSLKIALGIDMSIVIAMYNGLEEFTNDPTGTGATFYKQGVKLENMVTLGATLLSNTTEAYASFAVLMDQSLGRAALNATIQVWNHVLQLNASQPALNLNDPSTLEFIYWNAGQYVHASRDWTLPSQLNQLTSEYYAAVGQATANLADLTDDATTETDLVKTQYYAQNTIAPQIEELVTGSMSVEDFATATSPSALSTGLAETVLPTAESPSSNTTRTSIDAATQAAESSSSSSDSGLSGGAIAGIVIGCIVGVALIALAAAMLVRRRSSAASSTPSDGMPRRLWGRRDHDAMGTNSV